MHASKVTKIRTEGLNPETIQELFMAHGIRFKDLADELGVSRTSISLVVNGKSVSDRIQRAIASKLGLSPEQVFPKYYERRKLTKPEDTEKQEEVQG